MSAEALRDRHSECSEARSHGSSRSSLAEQEQGLLGAWEEDDDEKPVDRPNADVRRWTSKAWLAFVASVLIALIITVAFVSALGGTRESNAGAASGFGDSAAGEDGVNSNDYILDPNWDIGAAPRRREYTWTVEDVEHNPDGVYRPMLLVNRQFPGPLIEANEGDTIVVHVNNQATNATSVHWHGIYQVGSPHMDGTVGITQCPITPGSSFTYEFTVSGQSGTYWWHAHQGIQSSDGMHGPVIIHGRHEKQQYATDRVLLLSDHYHELASALLWQYLKPDGENVEPIPQSGLLNGRTVRNCDDFPEKRCDNTTANVKDWSADLAPGQSHRLRIINVGTFAEFQVQVDEHELSVIEVDGTEVTSPTTSHRVQIQPAQRYSVVVNTTANEAETFWLRARMIARCFKERSKTLEQDVYGIVRYNSAVTQLPTSTDWEDKLYINCKDMNTSELNPVPAVSAPEPDAFFHFRLEFDIGDWRLSRGFFDKSTWRPEASSPTLFRTIDGLRGGNTSFAAQDQNQRAFINDVAFHNPQELVLQTTTTQVIDILIENFDDGAHPLHLHGYKFLILAAGHGYPPQKSVIDGISRENIQPLYDSLDLSNPLRRDTASVEGFGWILIRLVTDNPGAWAFHCHVSWHTEAGLLMQLLTRTEGLDVMQIPQEMRDMCGKEGLEKGMAPENEVYREMAMEGLG